MTYRQQNMDAIGRCYKYFHMVRAGVCCPAFHDQRNTVTMQIAQWGHQRLNHYSLNSALNFNPHGYNWVNFTAHCPLGTRVCFSSLVEKCSSSPPLINRAAEVSFLLCWTLKPLWPSGWNYFFCFLYSFGPDNCRKSRRVTPFHSFILIQVHQKLEATWPAEVSHVHDALRAPGSGSK